MNNKGNTKCNTKCNNKCNNKGLFYVKFFMLFIVCFSLFYIILPSPTLADEDGVEKYKITTINFEGQTIQTVKFLIGHESYYVDSYGVVYYDTATPGELEEFGEVTNIRVAELSENEVEEKIQRTRLWLIRNEEYNQKTDPGLPESSPRTPDGNTPSTPQLKFKLSNSQLSTGEGQNVKKVDLSTLQNFLRDGRISLREVGGEGDPTIQTLVIGSTRLEELNLKGDDNIEFKINGEEYVYNNGELTSSGNTLIKKDGDNTIGFVNFAKVNDNGKNDVRVITDRGGSLTFKSSVNDLKSVENLNHAVNHINMMSILGNTFQPNNGWSSTIEIKVDEVGTYFDIPHTITSRSGAVLDTDDTNRVFTRMSEGHQYDYEYKLTIPEYSLFGLRKTTETREFKIESGSVVETRNDGTKITYKQSEIDISINRKDYIITPGTNDFKSIGGKDVKYTQESKSKLFGLVPAMSPRATIEVGNYYTDSSGRLYKEEGDNLVRLSAKERRDAKNLPIADEIEEARKEIKSANNELGAIQHAEYVQARRERLQISGRTSAFVDSFLSFKGSMDATASIRSLIGGQGSQKAKAKYLESDLGKYFSKQGAITSICDDIFKIPMPTGGRGVAVVNPPGTMPRIGVGVHGRKTTEILDQNPETGELFTEYLYKLTYTVSNPHPKGSSNDWNYNLYLYPGRVNLWIRSREVKEGETESFTSSDMLVFYSEKNYDRICIEFQGIPLGMSSRTVCNKIVVEGTSQTDISSNQFFEENITPQGTSQTDTENRINPNI